MGEFYTAIGVKEESGPFCVIKQGERVFLARAEQLLWTTLQGQFLEKNEIYPEMCFEKAGGCAKKADEEEVSYCLRRLTNRRLVVKVMANGAEDAQKMPYGNKDMDRIGSGSVELDCPGRYNRKKSGCRY